MCIGPFVLLSLGLSDPGNNGNGCSSPVSDIVLFTSFGLQCFVGSALFVFGVPKDIENFYIVSEFKVWIVDFWRVFFLIPFIPVYSSCRLVWCHTLVYYSVYSQLAFFSSQRVSNCLVLVRCARICSSYHLHLVSALFAVYSFRGFCTL